MTASKLNVAININTMEDIMLTGLKHAIDQYSEIIDKWDSEGDEVITAMNTLIRYYGIPGVDFEVSEEKTLDTEGSEE